jgi:hypothetical protein
MNNSNNIHEKNNIMFENTEEIIKLIMDYQYIEN